MKYRTILWGAVLALLPADANAGEPPSASGLVAKQEHLAPGRFAGKGLVVGLEYAVLDNAPVVKGMARAFAETGLTGMKHYPEAVAWGAMQKGPDQALDFTKLDLFVREYQNQGFSELTLCLKPHSSWGSQDVSLFSRHPNASPKPEHRQRFAAWVSAVVERYDGDGRDDMPGLRSPVRYVEIGSEFSSYQPEPVAEYLETLALAYRAAHQAFPDVCVGHVAFLITPVNLDVADPADYARAWAAINHPDKHHGLADQRAVLDHPELFDFVNLHNLGSPYEIEHLMRWLRYEMGRRKYTRPVVISDTTPTSYIGWGSATVTTGKRRGTIAAPATEADRPRLAEFFRKLVNKDAAALAWARGFVAADHVQRTIIAAEQEVRLINLAFTGDLPLLTEPLLQAGAGLAAWGGAVRVEMFTGTVKERYPPFYAIQQLMGHLQGYESVERVRLRESHGRVYRVRKAKESFWVAWRDPGGVLLPEDGQPSLEVSLPIDSTGAEIESTITAMGQTRAQRQQVRARNGQATLQLTHTPVFVFPD
jgi:hypothetical protein